MHVLDLSPDELLTTTRAVRKRLDFSRPVEPAVIRECLELALQAPTGANSQTWQFVAVTDPQQRQALGPYTAKGLQRTLSVRHLATHFSATVMQRTTGFCDSCPLCCFSYTASTISILRMARKCIMGSPQSDPRHINNA